MRRLPTIGALPLLGLALLALGVPAAAQPAQPLVVHAWTEIGDGLGGFAADLKKNDDFGGALAALGDLDGDGVTDLAVGVPRDDIPVYNQGSLWILLLNADGTIKDTQQKISSSQGGFAGDLSKTDGFARALAGIGDLDGDGVPDLVVGVDQEPLGTVALGNQQGGLWVLFLNADGTVRAHQRIGPGNGGFGGVLQPGDSFGKSVAPLHDILGDSVIDLIVGAPGTDTSVAVQGTGGVWLVQLHPNGTVKAWRKISATSGGFTGELLAGDAFGSSVAYLGQLELAGRDQKNPTIAVGAPGDDEGKVFIGDLGAVWLLALDPQDGTVVAHRKIDSSTPGFAGFVTDEDNFGCAVASPGDWDGDGVADLLVGARYDNDGCCNRGAVWLILLNDDGTVKDNFKISNSPHGLPPVLGDGDNLGSSVATLGDLDGDGRADLAAGAAFGEGTGAGPNEDTGSVWLLRTSELRLLPGDRVDGTIHRSDDHIFAFQAAAGTRITFKCVAVPPSKAEVPPPGVGTMKPALRILAPDGAELIGVDETQKGKKALVKKLLLPATGRYQVEVVNLASVQGDYRLRWKAKTPKWKKIIVPVAPGEEPQPVALDAVADTLLKKLSVKRVKPKGDFAAIGKEPADLKPQIEAFDDPAGQTVDYAEHLSTNAAGTSVAIKKLPLEALGSYLLSVGGAGGSVGYATVAAKLKFPRGKTLYELP